MLEVFPIKLIRGHLSPDTVQLLKSEGLVVALIDLNIPMFKLIINSQFHSPFSRVEEV